MEDLKLNKGLIEELDIDKIQAFMSFWDKLKSKRFWYAILVSGLMLGLWIGNIIPAEYTLHIIVGVFVTCIAYLVSETVRPSLVK